MKKVNKVEKGFKFLYANIHRRNIIGESKNGVLIECNEGVSFWIDKKFVHPSKYTFRCSVSIVEGWNYNTGELYQGYGGPETLDSSFVYKKLLELN